MTFQEIVSETANRLNLTSDDAINRIGRAVNERYKWALSSIGMQTSRRETVTSPTIIGQETLVFPNPLTPTAPGVEKLYSVFNAAVTPKEFLDLYSVEELRTQIGTSTDPTHSYAIWRVGPSSVTILLGSIPTTVYTLSADVEENLSTLSNADVPDFPEDFHHILLYGAMATELEKLEKYDLADRQEKRFNDRLSDLRMYIIKSGFLDINQGKTQATPRWRFTPFE